MGRNFVSGDRVLLVDRKGRRYLITLSEGGQFHCHSGIVEHDELIGSPDGSQVKSNRGSSFLVFEPSLSDYILEMPRGAQVIYPKDLGAILLFADVCPGDRILESGIGSGALSMTLLRAGARIIGYEIRDDFATRAQENVEVLLGESVLSRYEIKIRDIYKGIDEVDLDRVILDLPEPWRVVSHAAVAMRSGGIILAYTPSIVQAANFREALSANGFGSAETVEVMNRTWHIDGAAVRPAHRMVAHTGFLSYARLLAG